MQAQQNYENNYDAISAQLTAVAKEWAEFSLICLQKEILWKWVLLIYICSLKIYFLKECKNKCHLIYI